MNFHDLCFCHIPWKERKRTTNCAIITPFPWSIFRYSLDQSARKKSACYQIKKNCVWRFVNPTEDKMSLFCRKQDNRILI